MVLRLVLGILAVTFLPLGLVFLVVGLVAETPDRGTPEGFLYAGAGLGLVGVGLTIAFVVLWRRETERRRRRQAGLRASAEVVRAHLRPNVRSGSSMAMDLTVRFPSVGTPEGTVTQTLFVSPSSRPAEGSRIEILYDPADPSNFEPVAAGASLP